MAGPWEDFQKPAGPWTDFQPKTVEPEQPKPQVGYGEDVAKSIIPGLTKGVAGIAGFPDLLGRGVQYLEQKLSGENDAQYAARLAERKKNAILPDVLPTTEQAQAYLENKVPGSTYQPQTLPGQYTQTAAEFVPGALLGPGGTARTLLGRAGQKALQYGIAPGLTSEAAGQAATGTDYEGVARLGGALAGPTALSAARHVVTPLPTTPARQAANATMQAEGVDLTAGQRTGSMGLKYLEAESGGPARTAVERQKEQFTGAVLRRAGENADRATPEVVDNMFNRLGGQFDGVAARNNLGGDQRLVGDLTRTWRQYTHNVPESMRVPGVEAILQDITNGFRNQAGVMDGAQYGTLRSRLGALARQTKDNQLRDAYTGIQHALDDAFERSLARSGSPDLGVLQETRRQYRNALPIARAAEGGGPDTAAGLLSPEKMRQVTVATHGGRNYARGTGDLARVVRAGNETMSALPQSGTSPRLAAQAILGAPGAALGYEEAGGAGAGIGGVVGALGGRYLLGRSLMNPLTQRYLGNQVLQQQQASRLQQILNTVPSAAFGAGNQSTK